MHFSLCKVHITLSPNLFYSVQFLYLKCFLHVWTFKTARMKFIDRLNHPQTIVPRDVNTHTHTHTHTVFTALLSRLSKHKRV